MRFILFFTLFSLFACKRNHTNVLVKTLDNKTGQPISNIKIKVYRKGKETFFIKKESLVVAEGFTNNQGQALLNFKYDRGNKYSVEVFDGNNYWGNASYTWTDLEKGKNEATFDLYPYCYLKLNLKSIAPGAKTLNIKINDFESFYFKYFPYQSNAIDTMVFCLARSIRGNKNVTWSVDSSGYEKNYSLPVELKGHDTAYATINF